MWWSCAGWQDMKRSQDDCSKFNFGEDWWLSYFPCFRGGRKGKKSNHDCDDKKNKGGLVHRIRNENNCVPVNSPLKLQKSLCTEEWAASEWTSSILANPRVDRALPGPIPRLESPSLRGRCWRRCPWGRKLSAETRRTSSEASSPAGTLALFHAIT